jgi:hypothetical protein
VPVKSKPAAALARARKASIGLVGSCCADALVMLKPAAMAIAAHRRNVMNFLPHSFVFVALSCTSIVGWQRMRVKVLRATHSCRGLGRALCEAQHW